MGWDIVSLGNHQLDTSNLETLAKQLSDAFNINIDYGYLNIIKYNEVAHCVEFPDDYNFHKIGRIPKARNRKLYRLTDDFYNEKIIVEKFGGKLENVVYSKFEDEDQKEFCEYKVEEGFDVLNKGREQYHLRHSSNSYKKIKPLELTSADIMNDTIKISIKGPFRWFGFVNQLKKNNEYFDDFVKYRNRMAEYYKKIGAEQIVYFPDQGVTELIMDKMWNNDWADVLRYIKNQDYYFDYVKIDFFDKQYKQWAIEDFNDRHNALQISLSDFFINNKPFFEVDDNLEILFDDFKDLYER